ncbi:uncharacterized protein TEOVI_000842500 [Trypanosoma equiperdum]|uniref:Uncharacterized protein n=2 Tax=Trypanozoon TaxID=39700 RepID=Q38AH5_TRYB2|nr:hypothetical protein, conserved [Trypanosoma brucei brucei TREU927]EAN78195.1 hypothetical protein, conserved [Trypanosoma brucei brucei TREU927]SCU64636.1 hypothetical protein, conserved [Trypanosoma equiperdum]
MLRHGSHPEHPMQAFPNPVAGLLCSICKASAHPSMTEWYHCAQEGCRYTLCRKCQEIDEQLFDTPQVVIRSPILAYDNMDVCLRTRPRNNAHVLCPLYPARLMVAVASARGSIDPTETYYRLGNGGWTNAAHVVRVVPSQQLIEELAGAHLVGGDCSPSDRMSLRDLLDCIDESFRLMEQRSPYGLVMASLIYYPLIQYCSDWGNVSSEGRVAFVRASLGFIHYVFHYVLDELNQWLENYDPMVKTTILSLYVELLGKSLTVARDLALSQAIALPSELGPLVVETARVIVELVPVLDNGRRHHIDMGKSSMRDPSVALHQRDFGEEQLRLLSCCQGIVETAGWLLLHVPVFTYGRSDILPFRVAVSFIPNSECLERLLCQVTTSALEKDATLQKRVHDLDVVEVAVSLAARASCAESQLAVFRVIAAVAHESPGNISQIAPLVIAPLIKLATKALNTLVANAAFDCFTELAYNEPRPNHHSCDVGNEETESPSLCSAVLHPNTAPYQTMHAYKIAGRQVLLCEYCSQTHLPAGSVPSMTPQRAHFHCYCRYCPNEHVTQTSRSPTVGPTSAIQLMINEGITHLMLFWLRCGEFAVANTVGRLSLKIAVPPEVIVTLYHALLRQSLVGYADAALAVAAQAYLPVVKEMQRRYPNAAISQYLSQESSSVGCKSLFADCTPGEDTDGNDVDGLSPSPDIALRSSDGGSVVSSVSPPVTDLFTMPNGYLNVAI